MYAASKKILRLRFTLPVVAEIMFSRFVGARFALTRCGGGLCHSYLSTGAGALRRRWAYLNAAWNQGMITE
jgi:hypothetical protein